MKKISLLLLLILLLHSCDYAGTSRYYVDNRSDALVQAVVLRHEELTTVEILAGEKVKILEGMDFITPPKPSAWMDSLSIWNVDQTLELYRQEPIDDSLWSQYRKQNATPFQGSIDYYTYLYE